MIMIMIMIMIVLFSNTSDFSLEASTARSLGVMSGDGVGAGLLFVS